MPDTVAPGRVLGGRYRLHRELARGGMASVWLAEDPLLSREVAVKILHPELAVDDALRVRFRHEAVSAAKLTHPGIVATYDTGDDNGTAYIVMELVHGSTLRNLIRQRGQLPIDEAVEITAQVADALEHAHRQGLVHRDIKPANVLVQPDGRVKVTDFGIAKAAGAEDLTRSGTVIGTARYLAPEQVNAEPVDARADVYALGLVLYEMLTGKLPFSGDSEVATAVARLTAAPEPVRRIRPEVPMPLEDVVAKSLARDPGYRYPTARAVKDALAPMRDTTTGSLRASAAGPRPPAAGERTQAQPAPAPTRTGPPPPPARPTRRVPPPRPRPRSRRWLLVLLVLVLLAAGAVAGYFAIRQTQSSSKGGSSNGGSGGGAAQNLTITGAKDFDPEGNDKRENPDQVDNAIDGKPGTVWSTETYFAPAEHFGNSKSGVGLSVQLDGQHEVSAVTVTANDANWSAQIYVADQQGNQLSDWGQAKASKDGLGRVASFEVKPAGRGSFVLVWITQLPSDGKLGIDEVTVAGR